LCFRSQGWEISTFDYVCSIVLVLLIIKNPCFPSIKRNPRVHNHVDRAHASDVFTYTSRHDCVSICIYAFAFSYFVLCLNGSYSPPLPFREMSAFQIRVMVSPSIRWNPLAPSPSPYTSGPQHDCQIPPDLRYELLDYRINSHESSDYYGFKSCLVTLTRFYRELISCFIRALNSRFYMLIHQVIPGY
jgi:hypothetical protein